MPRTSIIDGDIYAFQAACVNECETQWDTWLWTLDSNLDAAIATLDGLIAQAKEVSKSDAVIVALSDTSNWRKDVMPTYKEHRKKTRKPICYVPLREYIGEVYNTYSRPGLEGDDVVGILATHKHLVPGEKVIVSIDKDLKTIPGLHLRLDADEGDEVQRITIEEADRFHLLQTLSGDQTDGYPGCPGVGAVRAAVFLDEGKVWEPEERIVTRGAKKGEKVVEWKPGRQGSPWEVVVSVYAAAGLSEAVALENARVARICRASDYDYDRKEPILWTPQTT